MACNGLIVRKFYSRWNALTTGSFDQKFPKLHVCSMASEISKKILINIVLFSSAVLFHYGKSDVQLFQGSMHCTGVGGFVIKVSRTLTVAKGLLQVYFCFKNKDLDSLSRMTAMTGILYRSPDHNSNALNTIILYSG